MTGLGCQIQYHSANVDQRTDREAVLQLQVPGTIVEQQEDDSSLPRVLQYGPCLVIKQQIHKHVHKQGLNKVQIVQENKSTENMAGGVSTGCACMANFCKLELSWKEGTS